MERKKIIISSATIAAVILLVILLNGIHSRKSLNYKDMEIVCFDRDILPVFKHNCGVIGCHDQQSSSANYVLSDYNSIVRGVRKFNPDKSIVYKSIIGEGASLMPPGIALTENEKIRIQVWIGQGAKNTSCPSDISLPENKLQLNVNL
jgi:hypothetical protein